ncbi:MAG TPA: hypothetical protein VMW69_08140, partial [Spirochaetia bacterium]|nr:hypothetical protein [Spirochaetia bacterium]
MKRVLFWFAVVGVLVSLSGCSQLLALLGAPTPGATVGGSFSVSGTVNMGQALAMSAQSIVVGLIKQSNPAPNMPAANLVASTTVTPSGSVPASFLLSNVPSGTYAVVAFLDLHNSQTLTYDDPFGVYPGITNGGTFTIDANNPGPMNVSLSLGWKGPGGFLAGAYTTTGGIPLSWNAMNGASSYTVVRNSTPSFDLSTSTIVCQNVGTTSCSDMSTPASTSYYYAVGANLSTGTSFFSKPILAATHDSN